MDRAPLIAAGGALVIEDFLTPSSFAALQAECRAARLGALEQVKIEPDLAACRSGNPNCRLTSAEGGAVQTEIYNDLGLAERISALCGKSVQPTGERGSYSYYDQPGYFLGLHRDIPGCDVTQITCLHRQEATVISGALRVYTKCSASPLSEIGPQTLYRDIHMRIGQSILLLGGYIPHEVLPAAKGYARHISVLCLEFQE